MRTPEPATRSRLASNLGTKDRFEQSIADFSKRYADQNDKDYQKFCAAIRSGQLEALEGRPGQKEPGRRECGTQL